jgi:hypothetical protein
MSFLYDSCKLTALEEVGEIAFPPSEYKTSSSPA